MILPLPTMKHIMVLLAETSARTLLRVKGINDFFLGAEGFHVEFLMADQDALEGAAPPDGVICIGGPAKSRARGVPLVGVGGEFTVTDETVCKVEGNLRETGRMAAEILVARGITRAIMISSGPDTRGSMWQGFSSGITGEGLPCVHLDMAAGAGDFLSKLRHHMGTRGCGVLLDSPRLALPLGDTIATSKGAFWVASGDAPELSEMLGLTSIVEASRRMGWLAAACLIKAMRGDTVPAMLEVPPLSIHSRRSTYPFAGTGCEEVERALAFIRQSSGQPIGVDDVARAAGVSRSVLQRRVKETLDTSVLNILQWHRVEKVKTCLSDRAMGMEEISESAGFSSSGHMNEVFKKYTGKSPTEFRIQLRENAS